LFDSLLQNNNFFGGVPNNISSLIMLEVLDLRNNCLTGEIPAEIGDMQSIKLLSVEFTLLCTFLIHFYYFPPESTKLFFESHAAGYFATTNFMEKDLAFKERDSYLIWTIHAIQIPDKKISIMKPEPCKIVSSWKDMLFYYFPL
jgi:hypothetical protein